MTLGIIGGGQLGRMLVQAAQKLKIKTIILDPTPMSPAGLLTDQIIGDYKDPKQIRKLSKKVDVLTFEIESANVETLKELESAGKKVQPSPQSLEIIQDKLTQKQFLLANNFSTAEFTQIKSQRDLENAAEYLGYPMILKSRFHGFDGRGNAQIKSNKQIKSALTKLKGKDLYVEKFIPFKKELAVQVARDINGNIETFPIVETIQKNNICHLVKFPSGVSKSTNNLALKIAKKVVSLLSGSGVFGIEMFLTEENKILVNEIAPRVHNSGHWTIDGCNVSQFEEHIRAVCNLPLKSPKATVKSAVMINILGDRNGRAKVTSKSKIKLGDNTFIHIYDKLETRKERKMGHITVVGSNQAEILKSAVLARSKIQI